MMYFPLDIMIAMIYIIINRSTKTRRKGNGKKIRENHNDKRGPDTYSGNLRRP
jgi:hypothetical protein